MKTKIYLGRVIERDLNWIQEFEREIIEERGN